MARFIFITGGVVSSLGKGLMAASLGALLQARGYQGPNPEVRSLSERRSGDDVALSAWRGLCDRRRGGDRPRPRPLRALHRRLVAAVGQYHLRAHLSRHHRCASGAATISARPSRSSRTSPTRSRSSRWPRPTGSISSSARSAARSATSKACRSSRRSASCATTSAAATASSSTPRWCPISRPPAS